MENGLAEILVIDGQRPVVRLIGFVELRFKVERIKIGVTGIHPARADHILGVVRSQPCIQNIGGEVRKIRFIALEHLRRDGVHLFVIGLLDGVDEHIVLIPVIGVLRHDAASLRLKRGEDICAVIEQLGVVCSEHIGTVFGNAALHECTVCRQIAAIVQNGQEIRSGLYERIFQRQIVHSLYTDILGLYFGHRLDGFPILVGGLGSVFAFQQIRGIFVIFSSVCDDALHHVFRAAGVFGVQCIDGGVDKILRRDRRDFLARIIVPFHAFAQMECPGQAILAGLPAFGQSGLDGAVSIIFHQRIDNVRGNDQIVGAARDKIVHRGDFTRIHLAERSAASGALAAACKAAHNQCQTQKDRE